METIKRYSMRTGNMAKDANPPWLSNRSKGVSEKFLDTAGRRRFRFALRIFGLMNFTLTVLALVNAGIVMLVGNSLIIKEDYIGWSFAGLFILFFINTLGMFAELAGDQSGINWYAKGFLLTIISFGSSFMLMALLSFF